MIKLVTDGVKTGAASMRLAENAPTLSLVVILLFGVFYYMERRDSQWIKMLERGDEVQSMRIDECHRVQDASTLALLAVAEGMKEQAFASQSQSLAFKEFSIRLETHTNNRQ